MAVQGTIETMGGLTATNAYLRISDLTVKKIVSDGDDNNKWQLTYGVFCYVNANARTNNPQTRLVAPSVDRFKVVSDDEPSDPMAVAYADLKTRSTVTDATDIL